MLKSVILRLSFAILGSAAIIVAADLVIFDLGTWKWTLVPRMVEEDDLEWWKLYVGPLPNPPAKSGFAAPPGIGGHPHTWYHRGGGDGFPGADGAAGFVIQGVLARAIQAKWTLIQGRAMASDKQVGFGVGVCLPLVALERTYAGPQGLSPPHPLDHGWHTVIHPGALALNIGIVVVLIGGPLLARDLFAMMRIMRGRCSRCGYQLLTGQDRCPECGARRRFIVRPTSEA